MNTKPTAEEWVDRFLASDRDRQLIVAAASMIAAEHATRCVDLHGANGQKLPTDERALAVKTLTTLADLVDAALAGNVEVFDAFRNMKHATALALDVFDRSAEPLAASDAER